MSSLLSTLGLRGASPDSPAPPLASYYLLFNVFLTYILLPSRLWKNMYGIDNNVSPREDVTKFGEAAVREGKMNRTQLNMVVRIESAHANSVENLPLLIGSLLFATHTGVPNELVNQIAFTYSLARIGYALAYIYTEQFALSFIRTAMWWVGTGNCFFLLWRAGRTMKVESAALRM